jgi:DNA-binding NtrC family response regulator
MTNRSMDRLIECVVLTSFHSEFTFLKNVFRYARIQMHHADSLDNADFLLTVTGSTVLMADVLFADGDWESALRMLSQNHPLKAMLVIAERLDRPYLQNVFDRGACGVLWKPFDFETVRKSIRAVHEASLERSALTQEIS